jgi:prepilin-type N-terminal cleavage/methylation domain-containing protein/prepilin-type processing-associated H-X9-DG protein
MHKKRAFTLIELLVVIAIIALLMSILMPALAKVKKQAMAVSCQARLKQWGVVFAMYTGDNDGYFHSRVIGLPEGWRKLWPYTYKSLYKDRMLRYCPTAVNDNRDSGPFGVWNPEAGYWYTDRTDKTWWVKGENGPCLGSYGMNRFMENITDAPDAGTNYSSDPAFWRRSDVKGGDKAPVLLDCQYVAYSVWPGGDITPPEYDGDYTQPETHWICINRHMGSVNSLFLDFSVRKVGLKELWTLKHSRTTDTCNEWTKCGGVKPNDWPEWMRGFKDY